MEGSDRDAGLADCERRDVQKEGGPAQTRNLPVVDVSKLELIAGTQVVAASQASGKGQLMIRTLLLEVLQGRSRLLVVC